MCTSFQPDQLSISAQPATQTHSRNLLILEIRIPPDTHHHRPDLAVLLAEPPGRRHLACDRVGRVWRCLCGERGDCFRGETGEWRRGARGEGGGSGCGERGMHTGKAVVDACQVEIVQRSEGRVGQVG
jgi:hypothetical protein